MKAFIDFVPVLLFFLTYIFFTDIPIQYIQYSNEIFNINLGNDKGSSIYFATLILMITYSVQCFILALLRQIKKIR